MGDFNSKVGKEKVNDIVGPYGLGTRNPRGDRLIPFCQEENFIIMNTFYKLPPRRIYTWKSLADSPTHIVRNQIDFIMVNKRFRISIMSEKHTPVIILDQITIP